MECWHCERPAHAVCQFCGRALCKAHVQEKPFVIHTYRTANGVHKAIVVDGSIYCGVCKPQDNPITLQDME